MNNPAASSGVLNPCFVIKYLRIIGVRLSGIYNYLKAEIFVVIAQALNGVIIPRRLKNG